MDAYQVKQYLETVAYDTGIDPDHLKSAVLFPKKDLDALDSRLEAYNQSFQESLERSLTLPVLQLSLEANSITLRPAGLLASLCVDDRGEIVQCVFAGNFKGDIQKGYGGDWSRYGLEVKWTENTGHTPLAYVDLGVSSFSPVLLVQEDQMIKVLWYADTRALCYSGDGIRKEDYKSSVVADTAWSLESLDLLMSGYERYLKMCRLHPNNYLGLQWLSSDEYQTGLR